MVGQLIISGNLAVFEYPEVDNPEFSLDENGILFIFGYSFFFVDREVGCARRFELNITGFKVIGKYQEAIDKVMGCDLKKLISDHNIDIDNCVFMGKSSDFNVVNFNLPIEEKELV